MFHTTVISFEIEFTYPVTSAQCTLDGKVAGISLERVQPLEGRSVAWQTYRVQLRYSCIFNHSLVTMLVSDSVSTE